MVSMVVKQHILANLTDLVERNSLQKIEFFYIQNLVIALLFGLIVFCYTGLPGSGKSYWAAEKQTCEPDKRYYVLGTNNIIDKMRVRLG